MHHFKIHQLITGFLILFMVFSFPAGAQINNDSTFLLNYIKKEFRAGIVARTLPEREEFRTGSELFREELQSGAVSFFIERQNRYFLPLRHELSEFRLVVGPVTGDGNIYDESANGIIDAERHVRGLSGMFQSSSTNRFYYGDNHYTLVHLDGWARYSYNRRTDTGAFTDSLGVTGPWENESEAGKFRVGFNARAGWGIGRIQPVNHYMTSVWLLQKYYPRRNFSEAEFMQVAKELGRIKHQRHETRGHSFETEMEQLVEFLKSRLYLENPEGIVNDWAFTEFRPRYQGTRFEFGPFFSYFNREPDFIYGGYLQFENQKYCNLKWNRKLAARLSYNSYKHHDWMLLETTAGWNWYPSLKNEWGAGVKYIPGMSVKEFREFGPVRHQFVPYVEYFSQISPRYRIEANFAWRVAPNDQFMMAGPEFSVSVYRSRY